VIADYLHLTTGLLFLWIMVGYGLSVISVKVAAFLLCFVIELGQMGIELAFSL
jgi:hypothetical protein